jgi:hypothetical protein
VGTLRTSEEGAVAAGEGRKAEAVDNDRRVDDGAKIIISSGPIAAVSTHTPAPAPRRTPITMPAAPEKQGGIGLVILLYLLAAAALGYAIYERYLM